MRVHIKPPPSDQPWFGFTSMPGIEWNLDSSFGNQKITSSHVALLIGNRFKRNGSKLFAVGTKASLIGTGATNGLIKLRKALNKNYVNEVEEVLILSNCVAYGVYMAISSSLRYQVLAGVIEQRMLEPLVHKHKLALSAMCFAIRTSNTFLRSLLQVHYK